MAKFMAASPSRFPAPAFGARLRLEVDVDEIEKLEPERTAVCAALTFELCAYSRAGAYRALWKGGGR